MTTAGRESFEAAPILGMCIHGVGLHTAARTAVEWAAGYARSGHQSRGRYICAANVHMVMAAYSDHSFRTIVNEADLVVPDGQPTVWALRLFGIRQRRRVRVTPDMLLEVFALAERKGVKLGLYGGTRPTLAAFLAGLRQHYPRLDVVYAWDPPFRPLTEAEDREQTARIGESGVQLLLVGLGCPKQERWMALHAASLSCVMIGVGAAFDVFGGRTRNAPAWMRDTGLEWIFRLANEPRRLWRRHVVNDPLFLLLLCKQWLHYRRRGLEPCLRDDEPSRIPAADDAGRKVLRAGRPS